MTDTLDLMYAELRREFEEAVTYEKEIPKDYGKLGYEVIQGQYSVLSPRPDRYYVTMKDGTFREIPHKGNVPPLSRMPVEIRYENDNKEADRDGYIYGPDQAAIKSYDPANSSNYNVGKHSHHRGSGMEFPIDLRLIQPLKAVIVSGMTIKINPGFYFTPDGVKWFPGANVDLNSNRPSTVSYKRWVIGVINPATNTLVIHNGSEMAAVVSLTEASIPGISIATADAVYIFAVKVYQNRSVLHEMDFSALYNIASRPTGGFSSFTVNGDTGSVEIEDGFELNIVGANGIQVTISGDTITIDASGVTSGMASFNVAADSGTPAEIEDGVTLTVAGGTGLSSVISGDTVTVNLDNTAVTPGSYTNTNLTVDAQGRIIAAANGTDADTGITQLTGDGTAGPGNGSQALTLATVNSDVGTFLLPHITVNGKGLVTAITEARQPGHRWKLDTYHVAGYIWVGPGEIEVNGNYIEKLTVTELLTTGVNSDWISGTAPSLSAGDFVYIYISEAGDIKLHTKPPNAVGPNPPVMTALVNQSTWDGTAAKGYNAFLMAYDTISGSYSDVKDGMIVYVYASTDSDYSVGRGRGSAAAGSVKDISGIRVITPAASGAGTASLDIPHGVAINNNDRLVFQYPGPIEYREESGVWYRLLDLHVSGNVTVERRAGSARWNSAINPDPTTTSTTFAPIDSTMALTIIADGSDVMAHLTGLALHSASLSSIAFDVRVDSLETSNGNDGFSASVHAAANQGYPVAVNVMFPGLVYGTHNFVPVWLRRTAGTATYYTGPTANRAVRPQFWVRRGHRNG